MPEVLIGIVTGRLQALCERDQMCRTSLEVRGLKLELVGDRHHQFHQLI